LKAGFLDHVLGMEVLGRLHDVLLKEEIVLELKFTIACF
jgi:hypothetical protein